MTLRISNFAGEIPKLLPRLLPDNFGQFAENTRLENGGLTPIRMGRHEWSFPEYMETIYRHNGHWYSWPKIVDVAPAPVAEDRLYITGDGVPKIMVGDTTYPLALKKPTTALIASHDGEVDDDLSSTILYTYTYVTAMDEESEPAPLSNELLWSPGIPVNLTGFASPPAGRAINRIRIYRSQTSTLGETNLYFIKEMPAPITGSFVDVPEVNTIQEPLPSLDYNPPPDTLQGITALPNGMMAGFVGKRLYFSEPYKPHAWPEKYVLTTDYNIVGLGVFGQSVAILTQGSPYVAVGTAPENMAMERLRVNLPCVSARGIADIGYAVVYPSHEGIVVVSNDGANLISKSLLTRDQWLALSPSSVIGGHYSGRYMASYTTYQGGQEKRGILIIDMTGAQPYLIRADDHVSAMFNEIGTGTLFVLKDGVDVFEWDSPLMPYSEQTWRSKKFVMPGHLDFACILIEGECGEGDRLLPAITVSDAYLTSTPTVQAAAAPSAAAAVDDDAIIAANRALIDTGKTGGPIGNAAIGRVPIAGSLLRKPSSDGSGQGEVCTFSCTVYADGAPIATVTELNTVVRLPAGFLALQWEVEIHGTARVHTINLAYAPSELAVA